MNFGDVSGELIALHLGDGTRANMACFVVAVAKALASESFHLGQSLEHFLAKSCFQISSFFIRNSVMGAVFLMMRSLLSSFRFLYFPSPHCLPLSPGGMVVVVIVGLLGGI